MTFMKSRAGSVVSAPIPCKNINFTTDEWKLILKALSAYQHHAEFRAVYEKARQQVHR